MHIILSPIAGNKTTTVSVNGLVVTVDNVDYDLSVIPVGGQAEAGENSQFIGTVTRDKVTVKYEYDSGAAIPDQSTDWDDYTFVIESGDVPCPIVWKPETEEEGESE